jgi:hypothetical protein
VYLLVTATTGLNVRETQDGLHLALEDPHDAKVLVRGVKGVLKGRTATELCGLLLPSVGADTEVSGSGGSAPQKEAQHPGVSLIVYKKVGLTVKVDFLNGHCSSMDRRLPPRQTVGASIFKTRNEQSKHPPSSPRLL